MAVSAPHPSSSVLDRRVNLWWPLAIGLTVATAALTLQSLHVAAAFVAVALVIGLHLGSRRAGLTALWSLWVVVPAIRRIFDLSEGYVNADPLALAPFIATGAVGLLELTRVKLSRRAKTIVLLAAGGFAFGAPAGFFLGPKPALFALVAYVSAVLAFVAGYAEFGDRPLSLARVLAVVAAPLALYGILQSLAPLTPWDAQWLQTVGPDFNSIGSKEAGTLRVFSTLNSPGTLAFVLALAIICLLGARRFGPGRGALLVLTLGGLGLTLVRSSWAALALALLLMLFVAPSQVVRRVLVVAAIAAIAFPLAVVGSPASTSVSQRANTFSNLGGDQSTQARLSTPRLLIPLAARQPLGVGLGSAGEASRLAPQGSFLRATDNALLSLMFQNGPVGFVLVMTAYVLGLMSVVRNARRRRSSNDLLVFGCMVVLTVLLLFGDVFYGVAGAIIWYLVGYATRRDETAGPYPAPS